MKKFDKNYIKYHLIVDFFFILAIVCAAAFSGMEEGDDMNFAIFKLKIFGCIGIVAYLLKTVYSFLYVKTSGYELKEKEIVCKRGVIFRKTSVLEYAKMHAVNKKQNFIHKIFDLAVLMVDSGATHNGTTSEIVIFENSKTVDELISKIKDLQSGKKLDLTKAPIAEEKVNLYNFFRIKII